MSERSNGLVILAHICGWGYFVAWTTSFYPQLILNFCLKNTAGVSAEFSVYNVIGFAWYSGFSIIRFIVQMKYDLPRAVETQDIAFTVHALVVWLAITAQILYYNGEDFPKRFGKGPRIAVGVTLGITVVHLIGVPLNIVAFTKTPNSYGHYFMPVWSVTDWLALVKVIITVVKYIPQICLNFRRKNTIGMAIWQFNLDILGGVLAVGQNFISAYNFNDWSYVVGNIPKLLIAIVSLIWDLVLLIQHYCLYKENNKADSPKIELTDDEEPSTDCDTPPVFAVPERSVSIPVILTQN